MKKIANKEFIVKYPLVLKMGLTFFLFLALLPHSYAQKENTISGYVRDADTGENLYAATVFDTNSLHGTAVNRYGFFSLSVPAGNVQLQFSYVGYKTIMQSLTLKHDTLLIVFLKSSNEIDEVTITANLQRNQSHGHQKIQMKDLEKLPSFLGEKDVMKSLMLLPGVQQGNEGSSGIYVRGGSPDQNLILLDNVPLYNTSHLFGLVSVFTPEALQSVDFYKGAFPARFGGRLSSIVDVRMKDGNKYERKTDLTLGILSSKLVHEGPIQKGKSSYLISARRTLLDLLVTNVSRLAQKSNDEATNPGYGFYDLNAKANLELDNKNHLHFSFYSGGDKLFVNYRNKMITLMEERVERNNVDQKWRNTIGAVKWNSQLKPNLFMNLTASGSHFYYRIASDFYGKYVNEDRNDENNLSLNYDSRIVSFGVKSDFDYYPGSKSAFEFGHFLYHHNYLPGSQEIQRNGNADLFSAEKLNVWEYGLYADARVPISGQLTGKTGLRTLFYSTNEKTFSSFEPRLALSYQPEGQASWTVAYTRMSQPIHLLTNSNIGLPSDIWVPATSKVEPEYANQVSAGVRSIVLFGAEVSMEAYYKSMSNVVSYGQGLGFMDLNEHWEDHIEKGHGRAWGLENDIMYNFSKLDCSLGYTLSWNQRKFDNINSGKWVAHKFDRRHKLDLGVTYDLGEEWTLSANWTFQSGVPVSLTGIDYPGYPGNIDYGWHDIFTGIELDNTGRIQYYPELNQTRLPAYHRLDCSFTKEWKRGKQTRQLSLGVYNAYSRQNPYFVYPDIQPDGRTSYKQVSLLPFLPSVSYRIRF